MTSQINPQNIDGAYPVAGQDNDSQGFRDNFTNTKTNFEYAKAEITDLQNKVVLKAALTGSTLDNDMAGSILSNAQLQNMSETLVALGTVSGAQTLNYAQGPYFTLTTAGSISIGFGNWPAAGTVGRCRLQIYVTNTSYTLTIAANTTLREVTNIQGYAALSAASGTITFNQTGYYEFEFETSDGGSTVSVFDLTRNLDPIYLPSTELLAAGDNVNLGTTSSYFSTVATGENNSMADGVAGQTKVLAYDSSANSGDTRIVTVANAGWKSSGTGTVTFTEFGQTATLMYINSKWFVTGLGPGDSNTLPTLG